MDRKTVDSNSPLAPSRRPLASLQGYRIADLPHDIIAGLVVAALTLPISMGYAQIVGLPVVYGLFASVICTFVFALVTSTRHIVFGMDSAVCAVAGSLIASIGLTHGSEDVVEVMPVITLLTAAFLLLFGLARAGRLARYIPTPVMHGFIAGISLTVILGQLAIILGVTFEKGHGVFADLVSLAAALPEANLPSALLGIATLVTIIVLRLVAPRVPNALVALVGCTLATGLLGLDSAGVAILGDIDNTIPLPHWPTTAGVGMVKIVGCAFVIAFVLSIESLLCLETFSAKTGTRTDGDRELLSFTIANAAGGLFGCAPCSASISRSAAAVTSGGRSQVASIVAALAILAVILVLEPLLYYLPRPSLSMIVAIALVDVVDFSSIAWYAKHDPKELGVFLVSACVVFIFGSIPGVIAGVVTSLIFVAYRRHAAKSAGLFGVSPQTKPVPMVSHLANRYFGKPEKTSKIDPGVQYATYTFAGRLNFLNIDGHIDNILKSLKEGDEALILKMSKVINVDSSAADKLIKLIDMLHARGMHVKIVRKLRPTENESTRYELRRIMGGARIYPNVKEALFGIERDVNDKRIETDTPVLSVSQPGSERDIVHRGTVRFPHSGTKVFFDVLPNKASKRSDDDEVFTDLVLTNIAGDVLAEYHGKTWEWNDDSDQTRSAIAQIIYYVESLK